jgi:5'-phosphate synthase pdxT subunit
VIATPRIGVLALQGDVREHVAALAAAGAEPVRVRRPAELDDVDAVVIPGGESTTIGKLLVTFDLLEPLQKRVRDGMPAFGSCAGMILLADRVLDGTADQIGVGGIDMTVRRNAFGRQVDSWESEVSFAVRQGRLLATAFHPELTADPRVHALFVDIVKESVQ